MNRDFTNLCFWLFPVTVENSQQNFPIMKISNLSKLEEYLQVPFDEYELPKDKNLFRELFSLKKAKLMMTADFAVLFYIAPQTGLYRRILTLADISMRMRLYYFKLSKNSNCVISMYGVYPSIEDPVAIFPIGTKAELYANRNILPPLSGSLKGIIRSFIWRCTGLHPSIAAIVFVIRKK